ncbi:MAG: penicillin-binding protein 2 [Kiritimatiellae bacterium]|nr:penicillin-binding protein 2 [Kiritimatiellia bacterium]
MKTSSWFILSLGAVYLLGFLVLGSTLFRLQYMDTGEFKADLEQQNTRRIRIPGLRGRILDRNGAVLAECRPSHCIQCNVEEFQRRGDATNTVAAVEEALGRLTDKLGLERPAGLTHVRIERHVKQSSAMPLMLWEDVPDDVFARFAENSEEFPGFEATTRPERIYPYGKLAAHVLGYTGRSRPDDADSAHFFEHDMKGREGVERYYNRFLTGVAGERKVHVDARGFRPTKQREAMMDDDMDADVAPSPGLDLRLTIDKDVQAVLEAQLDGVTGAGVVLDPRDGAVIALASAPTFDPNDCVPRLTVEVYADLTNAPAKRLQNRAISESYAPGSTFKPITALAALANGWLPDDEYSCEGVYRLGNLNLHCWDRWGHGPITLRTALEKSCNTFFCNLGTAVGTNAVITAARAFGLGTVTGIDLGGETAGVVPDNEWKRAAFNERWYPGDTCQMSIGQGMLVVTPLQMAVVAATLANGGKVFTPYLFARGADEPPPEPASTVQYDREYMDLVREGMRDVAETGTGRRILTRWQDAEPGSFKKRRFNLNVTCAGKTGTAEIGRGDTKRKNTWVIAFAPFEKPTVAIAMIVERGESGGSTVAPRVHAVLAHMFGETEIAAARPHGSSLERGD